MACARIFVALRMLAIGLGLAACQRAPARPAAPAALGPEEYAVYRALLAQTGRAARPLVIEARTESGDASLAVEVLRRAPPNERASVDPATLRDFEDRAAEPPVPLALAGLREDQDAGAPIVLFDDAARRALDAGGSNPEAFWRAFHARYPSVGGLLTLSRVGFNAARTQALVSAWEWCGGRCGRGALFLLERRAGAWVLVRQLVAGEA